MDIAGLSHVDRSVEGIVELTLDATEHYTTDVSEWMGWFVSCLGRAIEGAETTLMAVLEKARFWEEIASLPINGRQRVVINHLLDGLEGKLTTSRWARMTKCSQDTALRDITDLMGRGILVRNPEGGRSTSYVPRRTDGMNLLSVILPPPNSTKSRTFTLRFRLTV